MPRDLLDPISALQSRLDDLGWYKLNVDGIWGVGTTNAVSEFKKAHALRPRPLMGEVTFGLLCSDKAKQHAVQRRQGEPLWLAEARSLLGTREVKGPGDNPVIMDWADNLEQWYPGDDTAWCALFVAHCMAFGAPDEAQAFNRLGAREWLKYGVAASKTNPPLGAVIPMWRTHLTRSWHGHVIICTGQSATHIRGIGGNQSDEVSERWFPRKRVLGARVPRGYDGPPAPRAETGILSTNEA